MVSRVSSAIKVPAVTPIFWVIKLLTTAMGEALSDFAVAKINPVVAVFFGFVAFVVALVIQVRAKRYTPWRYWLAVSMVAVFGTMIADVIHIQFGVPYLISSTAFAAILAVVFVLWYWRERTLSIHSIRSRRRELFYWAAVVATFTLGTATGDMTASTLALGYFTSVLLFLAIILIPYLLYHYTGRAEVLLFWFAYIVTRPLGASVADWLSKPPAISGLGFGDGSVALVLLIAIAIAVAVITFRPVRPHDVEVLSPERSALER